MAGEEMAALVNEVVDHVMELVAIVDRSGTVLWANQRVTTELGLPTDEVVGRSALVFVHPEDLDVAVELLVGAQSAPRGLQQPVTYRLRHATGTWLNAQVAARRITRPNGQVVLVVSARLTGEHHDRENEHVVTKVYQRLAHMFNDAAIGLAQIGLDRRLLRVNPALGELLGFAPASLTGRAVDDLFHPDDRGRAAPAITRLLDGSERHDRMTVRLHAATGRAVHADVAWALVHDRQQAPLYLAMQVIDVSEQAELVHRSTHDPLTGLANRAELDRALTAELADTGRTGAGLAVLFTDLDRFKAVNDQHGHTIGDRLLVAVGERLRNAVRHGDLVCRLGGDEFVVLCRGPVDRTTATGVGARILHAIGEPFEIDGHRLEIGASVGIAVHRRGVTTPEALIERADAALYRAKHGGGQRLDVSDDR